MSKAVTPHESRKPLTLRHTATVALVAVVGIIVAFWVLSSLVGIAVFFIKLAVVVALVVGVFWLLSRFRR
jgi:hypothetical protein